jgi:hypothetical protein
VLLRAHSLRLRSIFRQGLFFRHQLSRCLARLLLAALTCTLIPSFPHPTLLMPRGIRMRGEPELSFEVFLPLFAPRASPLNILSVNLSKQAHFFWGWTRKLKVTVEKPCCRERSVKAMKWPKCRSSPLAKAQFLGYNCVVCCFIEEVRFV